MEGHNIRLVEYGHHYELGDPWCIYGEWTLVREIGAYPSGEYTLSVDLIYLDQVFNTPTIYPIGVVPFTVTGAAPAATPVPAFGTLAAFALFASLLLAVVWKLRQRSGALLVWVLLCVPFGARAQDTIGIQILLSDAPGAPTPAQVVSWLNASPRAGEPPLDAFGVVEQVGGDFLPDRATGGERA